jgi:hypothetical protein
VRRALWLVVAVLGGTLLDEVPDRPPVVRAGYRVLEGDFHVHTRLSDGALSPIDVVLAARRVGLDVVALTEHNTVSAGLVARWASQVLGGPIVIVGEEITTRDYHVIALGLEETIPGGLPINAALLAVRRQRGVSIAAHPVRRFWPALDQGLELLDGAEVIHPIVRARGGERSDEGWDPADLEVFYARLAGVRARPAAVASSDHHALNGLGGWRTLVFVREASAEGVLEALRAGRTAVVHADGRMTGDADMIAAVEAEPLTAPEVPSYRARHLLDAVLRTLGLVGLVVLVFVGRRR